MPKINPKHPRSRDWHDLIERVVRTFVQAFVAAGGVEALTSGDWKLAQSAAIGAGAAAISFAWNLWKTR